MEAYELRLIVGGFVGFVIYLALCGIISASAGRTGRGGTKYFFLALVLSPLGAYMMLSLNYLEQSSGVEEVHRGPHQEWICPNCSKSNLIAALRCVKCGYNYGESRGKK